MKLVVFCVVATCGLTEVNGCFGSACCFHLQGSFVLTRPRPSFSADGFHISNQLLAQMLFNTLMMAASTSETSVKLYQSTCHNNPEDSHIAT
jgi:hypothetical protein